MAPPPPIRTVPIAQVSSKARSAAVSSSTTTTMTTSSGSAAAGGGAATVAALPSPPPPPPPALSASSVVVAGASPDPRALLDTLLDSRHHHHLHRRGGGSGPTAAGSSSATMAPTPTTAATTFDPIDFLNRHYTTESVLVSQLPALREAVQERTERLDHRLSDALQRQSETAEATRRHVQDAKACTGALEHRIRLVKQKALQSERAVLEITKDMKRLDCAKRHLQRTITTLKRLHMLVHAVEQLRLCAGQRPFPDYKTASHLVEATRLLLGHFDAYRHKVEPMRLLSDKVSTLQEDLRCGLVRGFRVVAFGPARAVEMERAAAAAAATASSRGRDPPGSDDEPAPVMTVTVMQGGVSLIDSLGESVRTQFIHEFCQDQLGDYLKAFEPPSQEPKTEKRVSSFKAVEKKSEPEKSPSSLDQVERRFVWFRGVLQSVAVKFPSVFPSQWNLQVSMARHFLNLTRDHMLALLDGPRKDPDANNATILLKALQKTIVFEKEMAAWLQQEYGVVFLEGEGSPEGAAASVAAGAPSASERDAATTGVAGSERQPAASAPPPPTEPLTGVASAAFEDYMNPYIALEEQSMDEQLVEALEDRTVDTRGERPVFISSTNLFVYIKGSITRCTALTRGKAFYQLYGAFKDSLHKYAQILDGKLPKEVSSTLSSSVVGGISIASTFAGGVGVGVGAGSRQEGLSSGAGTKPASYRIPPGEEVTVCRVISTCEYCADTMEALEDLIRDTIDGQYKSKIDMVADQEEFHECTAKAIRVLVSGLMHRLENDFRAMSSTNWGTWDDVGEESSYVLSMRKEIEPFVTGIRGLLPTSYFRSFCDKFAALFSTTYYNHVVRLKRVNEPGSQQLQLDVYNLKTLFLKLPVLEQVRSNPGKKHLPTSSSSSSSVPAGGGSTIAPAMYTKTVQKQFGKIETLLKLVATPTDLLIDNFKVQWVGGSALDLQSVMSLKGLKRTEQASMLERFGVDPVTALKGATMGVTGATIMSERVQALQDQGSTVAAKVNSDLSQMRLKVDDFRKAFR